MKKSVVDFSSLTFEPPHPANWRGPALWWLAGMLTLVGISIAGLAMFLHSVEVDETNRRRVADAHWLDQTLRFHLRRLESDLTASYRQQQRSEDRRALHVQGLESPPLKAGQLLRSPGVVLYQGYVEAGEQQAAKNWPLPMRKAARDMLAAQALESMLNSARV